MVTFIKKRLQVFVSSTYRDLMPERQAAVEAILDAGHIPAGMELFAAGDESQYEVIKQWIDESDIFMLILGARYGSIEPKSGKSYIDLEYEHAVNVGKPHFACVISDDAYLNKARELGVEVAGIEQRKCVAFRKQVSASKMVSLWGDVKDIKIAVARNLAELSRRDGLVGWVRSDTAVNAAALGEEIARLSKENNELRTRSTFSIPDKFSGLTFDQTESYLSEIGVLEELYALRDSLGSASGGTSAPAHHRELSTLGLITATPIGYYKLTDDGRAFLNQLMLKRTKFTV